MFYKFGFWTKEENMELRACLFPVKQRINALPSSSYGRERAVDLIQRAVLEYGETHPDIYSRRLGRGITQFFNQSFKKKGWALLRES